MGRDNLGIKISVDENQIAKLPIEARSICRQLGLHNLLMVPEVVTYNRIPAILRDNGVTKVYQVRIKKGKQESRRHIYIVCDGPDPGIFYPEEIAATPMHFCEKGRLELEQRKAEIQKGWDDNTRMSRMENTPIDQHFLSDAQCNDVE
jgi:hypothetical protein